MSILFQLFRAEDLAELTAQQFSQIKTEIQNAMRTSPDVSLRLAVGPDLHTHWNDARWELQQAHPRIQLATIQAALRERAREVFFGLRNTFPGQPGGQLDPANEDILSQLINPNDLASLAPHQREIFEIAISCELSYFTSHGYLQSVKDLAYDRFRCFRQGQNPRGPDSPYRLWS